MNSALILPGTHTNTFTEGRQSVWPCDGSEEAENEKNQFSKGLFDTCNVYPFWGGESQRRGESSRRRHLAGWRESWAESPEMFPGSTAPRGPQLL